LELQEKDNQIEQLRTENLRLNAQISTIKSTTTDKSFELFYWMFMALKHSHHFDNVCFTDVEKLFTQLNQKEDGHPNLWSEQLLNVMDQIEKARVENSVHNGKSKREKVTTSQQAQQSKQPKQSQQANERNSRT